MLNKFKILIILLSSITIAQVNIKALENCVNFNVSLDRNDYFPGENIYLDININIDKGYHIYSVHPDKSLSPTYVEIKDSLYFKEVGIFKEPKASKKCDTSFNQYIYYHTDELTLTQPLSILDNSPPGNYIVNATLIYLACDPSMCIPRNDDFSFEFNTYFIYGLPPSPICYVGRKTIEIVLENYKSDFLYYFFNHELNKHVFSKTYLEHKKKLNKYRLNIE